MRLEESVNTSYLYNRLQRADYSKELKCLE